ncbi:MULTISPECIES: hypothetical protein [Streptomyces]|uniref:hypothetical protein n=1 Tax=Streptomyces TaxID=1883 RepID=UPI00025CE0F2|nr:MULTISPECIES: hypothetical protein [Streptomyces]EIF87937.1 hypothetical protein [Streptomyces tsukubensis NRRL18488]MYS65150.1 hypothetical protein [Streptomyces sp. SID5473]
MPARFKPSKEFIIVILIAVSAVVVLCFGGLSPAVSVQVVATVLAGIEAVRRLTAASPAIAPRVIR